MSTRGACLLLEPRNTSMRVRLNTSSTVEPGLRISLRDRGDLLQRLQHPVESAELFGCDQCLSAARLLISSQGAWRVQTYRLSYGYAIRSAVKNPISDGFELGGRLNAIRILSDKSLSHARRR